ncbi:Plasma membrane t-SNARE, secretory vesicle fusion, variant 2 [Orbilia ellipsospora]
MTPIPRVLTPVQQRNLTPVTPRAMTPSRTPPPNKRKIFFDEVTAIHESTNKINEKIEELSKLHESALSKIDEGERTDVENQINAVEAELSKMNNLLSRRIKELARQVEENSDQAGHIRLVERNFTGSIRKYQQTQVAYMKKMREVIARQYKIANPEATEEEIRDFVDGGPTEQIFVNVTMSTRTNASRGALKEAKKRYMEIQKIEKTVIELGELFDQMGELVWKQEEEVKAIENTSADIEATASAATTELKTAYKSAKSARSKKWLILWIVIGIILAAIIITVLALHPWSAKKSHDDD